jgi:signal transduction histidine kinase
LEAGLTVWLGVPYILGGLIAWMHRPESRFGPLMVIAGFVTFVATLQWTNADVPHAIGQAADLLPAVLFLHVFLAFPSGRLQTTLERALVAVGYVAAVGIELVGMALGGIGPVNLLEVASEPRGAEVLQQLQLLVLSGLCLIGIAVLVVRRRHGGRPLRRSMALMVESFALGLLMTAVLFVTGAFDGPAFETIRRVTFVVIGIAPVAFVIGSLSARLARSAAAGLFVELGTEPAPNDLRDALARSLRDPSLTLAYWLPEFESWADASGDSVGLPVQDGLRAMTLVERDGTPLAVLLHDGALREEPELLDAVSAAAGIALENGRLHAELKARLVELRGSRVRLIEAGSKERQRLERNLHDGAQQRLVALMLELRLVEKRLGGDAQASDVLRHASDVLRHARSEIATSLVELRDVAHGIHPAVVTAHGLAVALESLVARASVPVRMTVAIEERPSEALEVAAYYLVCESLANIGKHAHASSATIDVARSNGQLVIEVTDDGSGGADTERGSGLRGIADRVEALDGRLRIWTRHGHGTRVRAEIPCA